VDLKELRQSLLAEGLSMKTVKNIIAGTFRAMLRDAQIDGVIERSPFENLPRKGWWPEIETPGPDPLNFEEREKICEWFYANDRHYWPFVRITAVAAKSQNGYCFTFDLSTVIQLDPARPCGVPGILFKLR
jgi:hypothetical protein